MSSTCYMLNIIRIRPGPSPMTFPSLRSPHTHLSVLSSLQAWLPFSSSSLTFQFILNAGVDTALLSIHRHSSENCVFCSWFPRTLSSLKTAWEQRLSRYLPLAHPAFAKANGFHWVQCYPTGFIENKAHINYKGEHEDHHSNHESNLNHQ